ncbi:MAG: glycosyltransferase family 2 protein [Clostridia bacterium]|nr:glycosyltransferase family 2 protein [Clostridia bacterium]
MEPKISVIVPVYNVEIYLKKCVESLLLQTYQNIEIVLVDDGSPDNCPQLCDEYAKQHANITTYHKVNGGLSDARNYGVQRAQGDWIAFIDSDDYVEKTYVEDLWHLITQFNADMAITRIVRENEDGRGRPPEIAFESICVEPQEAFYEIYTGSRVSWSACGKLFHKKDLIKCPFPHGFYEDCACMYRLIDECQTIAIGNFEKNYHYVTREGSILRRDLDPRHLRIFEICADIDAYIQQTHPEMKLLSVILYRRCVTQLLNLQTMSNKTYNSIFLRYRPLFRKNLFKVLKSPRLSRGQKYYMAIHCTFPWVCRTQRKLLNYLRR